MSYNFGTTTSHRAFYVNIAPYTTYPFSVSGWFKTPSAGAMCMCDVGRNNISTDHSRFSARQTGQRKMCNSRVNSGLGTAALSTTNYNTVAQWEHGIICTTNSAKGEVWLNNGGYNINTNPKNTTGMNKTIFGAHYAGVWGLWYEGLLAEFGFWNVILSAESRAALAAGAAPDTIEVANLKMYVPFKDDAKDYITDTTFSVYDTAPTWSADHPNITGTGSVFGPAIQVI